MRAERFLNLLNQYNVKSDIWHKLVLYADGSGHVEQSFKINSTSWSFDTLEELANNLESEIKRLDSVRTENEK